MYWFETFRLPGLGPRGGRGSSAAGGGLGLRCVVADLGPVGAILMILGQLCSYGCSPNVEEVLSPQGWLQKKAAGRQLEDEELDRRWARSQPVRAAEAVGSQW